MVGDIVHYGVANMPGAVPRTSTLALTNATLPFILQMAKEGIETSLRQDSQLATGACLWRGNVVCEGVAEALSLPSVPLSNLI